MPPPSNDPWLDWLSRPAGARVRLLCVPHSGGGKEAFRAWPAQLPDVELCVAALPGKARRIAEQPLRSAGAVATELAASLSRDRALPWVIFGHSTGAIIGFELVRELRRRGLPPARALVASACGAPHLPSRVSLHALGDEALVAELQRLEGTPNAVLADPALRALFLPIIRADAEIGERYAYVEEPPLETPLFAYAGVTDPTVPVADVQAWERHAQPAVCRRFAGGHFYFSDDAPAFFSALRRDLA